MGKVNSGEKKVLITSLDAVDKVNPVYVCFYYVKEYRR